MNRLFFVAAFFVQLFFAKVCLADEWREQHAVLNCGEHRIAITLSCTEPADDEPFCPAESFAFINKTTLKARFLNFNFSDMGGAPPVTHHVSCVLKNSMHFMIVKKHNTANCMGCEWSDVYSEVGKYIGSTDNIYRNKFFAYKRLPKSAISIIFDDSEKGGYKVIESIDFERF